MAHSCFTGSVKFKNRLVLGPPTPVGNFRCSVAFVLMQVIWRINFVKTDTKVSYARIIRSTGGNNRTGWSSPVYERYLDEASSEMNPSKRFRLLEEAEALLVQKDVPMVPLFFCVGIQLYDPKVLGGIEGNLLDKHPLWEVYRK